MAYPQAAACPLLYRAGSWSYFRFFASQIRINSRTTPVPTCMAVMAV